jgi:glucosamine--fructose-6-phosphate aminotransferase (isomerizing)
MSEIARTTSRSDSAAIGPLQPDVMIQQVNRLASDVRNLTLPLAVGVRRLAEADDFVAVNRVYLTGSGDSYHASQAATMAFEEFARVPCEPVSSQFFLSYAADWMQAVPGRRNVVVATSASGRTPNVVQAIERARARGAVTVAVTTAEDSPLSTVADHTIVTPLPDNGRSPGIRTYQANLVGLLLFATALGERRNRYTAGEAEKIVADLVALGDVIERTNSALGLQSAAVAEQLATANVVSVVGSGPSLGTAHFAAAKIVEATGITAVGQELEEWWHVDRFANPPDRLVFMIAPAGRSRLRAIQFAKEARMLGRRVIAVASGDDAESARHAQMFLPIQGSVIEPLSPLVYHLFASHLASRAATLLGKALFEGGGVHRGRE